MEDLKNREFSTNPNFKFKQVAKETKCCFGINDIFDIYYALNENNELYLISADNNSSISIIRLRDNKLVKNLEGENGNSTIYMIRHFYNKFNQKDYCISSFKRSIIKIWDLTDNYNIIHSIKIDYSENTRIYSCLLYFPDKNTNYFITSSNESEENDYTNIYDLEKGTLISNLKNTNRVDVFYLLLWENNKIDYLIQCCIYIVLIFNLQTKKLINALRKDDTTIHNSACIIKKNEISYLYVGNINGIIDIWNLNNFQLNGIVKYKKSYFYHLLSWNNRYILVANKSDESIIIIDTMTNKVISVIKNLNENIIISLKKINHPLYGESLLSFDFSNKILLWTH